MKQTSLLFLLISLFLYIGCTRKKDSDKIAKTTQTGSVFVADTIELLGNYTIKDSIVVDFDSNNISDISIFAYWIHAGPEQQDYLYRLNTLNADYQILACNVSDNICCDTTMNGNVVTSSHSYNCPFPSGNIVTGAYAANSDQYINIPSGFYVSGIIKIRKEGHNYHQPYTYDTHYGNSESGYFFVKNIKTNNLYAILLQGNGFEYSMQNMLKL